MAQGYEADCFGAAHVAQTDMAQVEENIVALHSSQSGTSAPSNVVAGVLWLDTTNHQLKIRNEDNDAWITLCTFNTTLDIVNFLTAGIVDNSNATAITISATEICTFTNDPLIPDEVYGAGWNGSLEPCTKNAVYDKLEANVSIPSMVLIEQQTISNDGTINFTTGIDDTYDEYEFHFVNVIPADDNIDFQLRTSTDGGSSYDSSGYRNSHLLLTTDRIVLNLEDDEIGGNADEGLSGTLVMYHPYDGYTVFKSNIIYNSNFGNMEYFSGAHQIVSANNVDAVRFYFSSGNLDTGSIKLYGIRKS